MGLLDDLRAQAESKREKEEQSAAERAKAEAFYRENIEPRLVKAYQFFKELVEHLDYMNIEVNAMYPVLPDGKPLSFRQEGYTVVIDSSKALKKIDFTFDCVLDKPVDFEVYSKEAMEKQADRLDRYYIRYDRKDRKDTNLNFLASKFTLKGGIPLKVMIEAEVEKGTIRVGLRNFVEPGYNFYTLPPDRFNEEFLDQLGKYILRQDSILVGGQSKMSDEERKKIRDRLIVEQRIREQEMREMEERLRQEEEEHKRHSPKEQLVRAINSKVGTNKDKLKDLFNKLKNQAGFDKSQ